MLLLSVLPRESWVVLTCIKTRAEQKTKTVCWEVRMSVTSFLKLNKTVWCRPVWCVRCLTFSSKLGAVSWQTGRHNEWWVLGWGYDHLKHTADSRWQAAYGCFHTESVATHSSEYELIQRSVVTRALDKTFVQHLCFYLCWVKSDRVQIVAPGSSVTKFITFWVRPCLSRCEKIHVCLCLNLQNLCNATSIT